MYLVTGSTGFVGHAVVQRLKSQGLKVKEVTRNFRNSEHSNVCYVPSIDKNTDWKVALKDVEVVIHCAARAHRMNDPEDSLEKYRSVNTDGTVQLSRACLEHGVRRLVFVSSIKVCAESTQPGEILGPNAPLDPNDWYSQSKAEAEIELIKMTVDSPLELVIVRPPLVYGPGAKGNLERLVKIVSKQIPMPLGAIKNRRSFIGVENLADFLILASHHPKADGQVFNISEGKPVSTTRILEILSSALKKRSLLIPVPTSLLTIAAKLTGTTGYVNRLISNMEVDSTNCFELLEWNPPRSPEESIASLVNSTNLTR